MLNNLREQVGRASDIPAIIDDAFEEGCIYLLTEAYNRLKNASNYERNWHENMFTARLVVLMEQVRDEEDLNLRIDPECYQYFREVLEGNSSNPDRAPRIDIRIMGGWVQRDIYYAMEAKILVEKDWKTRKASQLRKRYIETGIDNFVTGKYSRTIPKGCMIGYVVDGKPLAIQNAINKWLTTRKRSSDLLQNQHTINNCPYCFDSNHIRKTDQAQLHLYHVFLEFEQP